jgi:hypothetical protein
MDMMAYACNPSYLGAGDQDNGLPFLPILSCLD